jgi:ABC-type polysaccharide/polyol phosphate transport system ATPase subunit
MSVIEIENITKRYRVGLGRGRGRELTPPPFDRMFARLFPAWWEKDSFNALDGVSLTIDSGENVGIVGHNGAGKTTLLKILFGIVTATSGKVRVTGRISGLIDLLVGFHPDLTGRENIFLIASLYGIGRKEMQRKIDDVLGFAEIGDYADTPLKRYSAGMGARLGFSTITALQADVMLVDEVLGVGDANFQRKCIDWLDRYKEEGGTLLFVSHNLGLVRSMTDRVIWMDHGRIVEEGPTESVLANYSKAMVRREGSTPSLDRTSIRREMRKGGIRRFGAGGARLETINLVDDEPDTLELTITYSTSTMDRATFEVSFADESGRGIAGAVSPLRTLQQGGGTFSCAFHPVPLRPGVYFPVVSIFGTDGVIHDRWKLDRPVVVDASREDRGIARTAPVLLDAEWST